MSKSRSVHFKGTKGEIVATISALSPKPDGSCLPKPHRVDLRKEEDTMSKSRSGHFNGTKSDIVATISALPPKPNEAFNKEWENVTNPRSKTREDYRNKGNCLLISFDPGQEGKPGFGGKDHYHIHNPDSSDKKNPYLDKNGDPVSKGSKASHIIPKEE